MDYLFTETESKDTGWITIDITPQTSPRPRLGKFGAYMPAKYKAYKDCIIYELGKHNIKPDDYSEIEIIAHFPYPASTPKKRLIDGAKMRKKPDYDNTAKTISDCLETMGIINNDSQLSDGTCRKRYTTNREGRIEFKLKL